MSQRSTFRFAIFLLSLLFLAACNNNDPPATTYTPGCTVNGLIDAINQANNDAGPGIIDLDPNCSYVLTSADNSTGFDIHTMYSGLPLISSEITIKGNNAVLDIQGASPAFGHFFVLPSGDLELYDLTLQNGRRVWGGAVIVFEGDFFASNTSFINNSTSDINSTSPTDNSYIERGGAIYNDAGRVRVIDDCHFQENHTGSYSYSRYNLGGAIYSNNGHLLVSSSTFDSNSVYGSGGAIYSEKDDGDESGGLVQITDSSFIGNFANEDGGAIVLKGETNGVFITTSEFTDNEAQWDSGGAIYSEASVLTVNFDTFEYNLADLGGAIYSKRKTEGSPSSLTSVDSDFTHNTASEIGGAIFSENSDVTLDGSEFNANTADSCGAFRNGGNSLMDSLDFSNTAPRVSSTSEIIESHFSQNIATVSHGGAICHVMGGMSIRETDILYNHAVTVGGGLMLLDTSELSGLNVSNNSADKGGGIALGFKEEHNPCGFYQMRETELSFNTSILNSRFVNNQACDGGGLWIDHLGWVNIDKSTFAYNATEENGRGGGIFQRFSHLNIKNSTFSGNLAERGGGLFTGGVYHDGDIPSQLRIRHSTFAYNTADETPVIDPQGRWGGGGINVEGDINIENSLFTHNSSDCSIDNVQSSTFSVSGVVDSDGSCDSFLTAAYPGIGPLSNNGGSTQTHALLPGSPLIDILPNCALSDDQRGESRPQGSSCDPGSYEFMPSGPPPPPLDPGSETSTTPRCALFDGLELSLVLLAIPQETTDLTLYLNIPGGVPGLELEIPGDTSPWIYGALLGNTELAECSFHEFASGRLYCSFTLPPNALGSARDLSLYLNECDDPIFSQPRVSIPEPQSSDQPSPTCNMNLNEASCLSFGGTFHKVTDNYSICICP